MILYWWCAGERIFISLEKDCRWCRNPIHSQPCRCIMLLDNGLNMWSSPSVIRATYSCDDRICVIFVERNLPRCIFPAVCVRMVHNYWNVLICLATAYSFHPYRNNDKNVILRLDLVVHGEGAHPLCATLSWRGLDPTKSAYNRLLAQINNQSL